MNELCMFYHIYIYIYTNIFNIYYVQYKYMCVYIHYYESQPVGLAEVIDASEASLGGPGGRAGKMCVNRVK